MIDKQLTSWLKETIISAGEIAVKMRDAGLEVYVKADNSLVSNADRAVSEHIYRRISALHFDLPIICEEQERKILDRKDSFWLIDPIDGTKGFVRGENHFTVHIALIRENKPVLGFVLEPHFKRLYYTDHGNNLIIEEDGVTVRLSKELNTELTGVVSPNHFNQQTKRYMIDYNIKKVITVMGGVKLCLIADGACDIFPRFGRTMEWDTAAGHALINATQGTLTDLEGNEMSYGKEDFLNPSFLARSKRWNDHIRKCNMVSRGA